MYTLTDIYEVSVPIRGLFNLTEEQNKMLLALLQEKGFRPHQGII